MYLITFFNETERIILYLKQNGISCNWQNAFWAHGERLMSGEHKQSGDKSSKLWTMNVWWAKAEHTIRER